MSEPGVHVILQARFHSTRLPGKMLLPLKGGSILDHMLRRLLFCREPEKVILATSARSVPYVERACAVHNVPVTAGSERDVLGRYARAVREHSTAVVVRATGDNPLVCMSYLDRAVRAHLESDCDLTVFPGLPYGTGVEVIGAGALLEAESTSSTPEEREHVTLHLYRNPHRFGILRLEPEPRYNRPDIRLTVDTIDDYLRVRMVYRALYRSGPIPLSSVIGLFDQGDAAV